MFQLPPQERAAQWRAGSRDEVFPPIPGFARPLFISKSFRKTASGENKRLFRRLRFLSRIFQKKAILPFGFMVRLASYDFK